VLIFAHTMKVSIWSSFVLDLTDFHFKTKISLVKLMKMVSRT